MEIEKMKTSLHDISIIKQTDGSTHIFLLFKDQNDIESFFKYITAENKQPSLYAVLLESGSHDIIIDFGKEKCDEKSFIKTHFKWNATEYPPITFLKEDVPFKVILGFKSNGKIYGTGYQFEPAEVRYIDAHNFNLPQSKESLN